MQPRILSKRLATHHRPLTVTWCQAVSARPADRECEAISKFYSWNRSIEQSISQNRVSHPPRQLCRFSQLSLVLVIFFGGAASLRQCRSDLQHCVHHVYDSALRRTQVHPQDAAHIFGTENHFGGWCRPVHPHNLVLGKRASDGSNLCRHGRTSYKAVWLRPMRKQLSPYPPTLLMDGWT
jgi:hypothetical protein